MKMNEGDTGSRQPESTQEKEIGAISETEKEGQITLEVKG